MNRTQTASDGRRVPVPIVIVAPNQARAVRVARYKDTAGATVIGNADFVPHDTGDGRPLQAVGSREDVLTAAEVSRLTSFGRCPSCSSRLAATAGAVDEMEIANKPVHCPMCSTSLKPVINYSKLTANLAAEVAGDFGDDDGDDGADDVDDSDGDGDDDGDDTSGSYDDMGDDDGDGSDGVADAAGDDPNDDDSFYADSDDGDSDGDGDDAGDDDGDDDGDGDSDYEGATVRARARQTAGRRAPARRRALADVDPMLDASDTADPMDELPMDGSDMSGGDIDGGIDGTDPGMTDISVGDGLVDDAGLVGETFDPMDAAEASLLRREISAGRRRLRAMASDRPPSVDDDDGAEMDNMDGNAADPKPQAGETGAMRALRSSIAIKTRRLRALATGEVPDNSHFGEDGEMGDREQETPASNETGAVRRARKAVAAAEKVVRGLSGGRRRALADDEVERTRRLNPGKTGNDQVRPSASDEDHEGDWVQSVPIKRTSDGDINTIGVGRAPARPRGSVVPKSATAALRKAKHDLVLAKIDLEVALDNQVAGRPRENAAVRARHEGMQSRLRTQRGARVDGNAPLRSTRSTVAGLEDDEGLVDPLGLESDEMNDGAQPDAPGTEDPTAPMDALEDVDGATPGTSFDDPAMAAVDLIDWPRARVEVIASTNGTRWVFANDKPVGTLSARHATASVQSTWDTPVMERAFLSECRAGLTARSAREFGFRSHRFRVQGSDATRSAIRAAHAAANDRATREVAMAERRMQQAVETAFLGIMKGAWQATPNPMRDALTQSLAAVSVQDPRRLVDAAVARSATPLLKEVFARARELVGKSDAARNEVASFVAEAVFQGRPSEGSALADRLDRGNATATAGAVSDGTTPRTETAAADDGDLSSRMARHTAALGQRR